MNASNRMGVEMDRDLRLFRGALERDENDPEDEDDLRDLVARGTVLRDEVRDVLHGTTDRKRADRAGRMTWVGRANKQRGRLWSKVSKAGFPGLDAVGDADLVYAGGIAPGRVVAVDDTGMTLNNAPKIRVRLQVQPGGNPPFEVERKLFVSRVMLPRIGETVTVYFDPDNHERFTFRREELADAPVTAPGRAEPHRLDRIEQLGRLRSEGLISDDEFEAEKRKLLDEGAAPSL
jgi:hypothetical protein